MDMWQNNHEIHGVSLPTRLCSSARSLSRGPFWCSWLTSMVAWIRLRSVPWPRNLVVMIWEMAWVLRNLFSPGAEANKWIVWANATLDPICFKDRGRAQNGTCSNVAYYPACCLLHDLHVLWQLRTCGIFLIWTVLVWTPLLEKVTSYFHTSRCYLRFI